MNKKENICPVCGGKMSMIEDVFVSGCIAVWGDEV